MRTISTIAELEAELREVDRAGSDAARRKHFTTFEMKMPAGLPAEPESEAYKAFQFDLYERISGKRYDPSNERTLFDVQAMADRPFPYLNGDWEVTGDQLMAMGWIIKQMKLRPGSTVLEFGPGWGNTTLALAQNGYAVTAIEIEPNFVNLINERVRRHHLSVETIEGDFLDAAKIDGRFDGVLFFESFHHCADHGRLIDIVYDRLNDDGVAVFCAEPIDETFTYPWGVRLDGQSLWAIRQNGWLELGFTETYFVRQLMARGFVVQKHVAPGSPLASCLVARKAHGVYWPWDYYLPPADDTTWGKAESDRTRQLRFTGPATQMPLQRGAAYRTIDIHVRNFAPIGLRVITKHGAAKKQHDVAAHSDALLTMDYDPNGRSLSIASQTWVPAEHEGFGDDLQNLGVAVTEIRLHP